MQSNCPQEMVVITNDGNLGILKTYQYLGSGEKRGDSRRKHEKWLQKTWGSGLSFDVLPSIVC